MQDDGAPQTSFETSKGTVVIRQIEPEDSETLARAYDNWSVESRYLRFMSAPSRLTNDHLSYLTRVDHVNHEALVAFAADTREPVGVARYVRLADAPSEAEVAVAVSDDWQGLGVGSALLARLGERAAKAGIVELRAEILATNAPAHALMKKLPGAQSVDHQGGVDIMKGRIAPDDDTAR